MKASYRRSTWEILEPGKGGKLGKLFNISLMVLIIVNVLSVMLETVETLQASYSDLFLAIELISVSIFILEYIGRVWTALEFEKYEKPIYGRIKFLTNPLMIIDLLAILPIFLTAGLFPDLRSLRVLRVMRILRLLKFERYSKSANIFERVIYKRKDELLVTIIADLVLISLAGTLMYELEHNLQPELFSSIPATIWWGLTVVTRAGAVGEPATILGKFLGGTLALLGVGLLSMPGAIIAAGLMQEYQKQDEENSKGED